MCAFVCMHKYVDVIMMVMVIGGWVGGVSFVIVQLHVQYKSMASTLASTSPFSVALKRGPSDILLAYTQILSNKNVM